MKHTAISLADEFLGGKSEKWLTPKQFRWLEKLIRNDHRFRDMEWLYHRHCHAYEFGPYALNVTPRQGNGHLVRINALSQNERW